MAPVAAHQNGRIEPSPSLFVACSGQFKQRTDGGREVVSLLFLDPKQDNKMSSACTVMGIDGTQQMSGQALFVSVSCWSHQRSSSVPASTDEPARPLFGDHDSVLLDTPCSIGQHQLVNCHVRD